jgi:protein-tyrosine phosphatase
MTKTAILFVCMGNICRSPTAEGVFRVRAEQAGMADRLHIDSAGTHAYHVGHPPDTRSSEFAAKRGYDLSAQRARQVEFADFARFDRIYAMDHENMARLAAACPPEHRHKLGLFMQFASNSGSEVVPDPYYGDGNGFDLVLDYIEDASDGLLKALAASEGPVATVRVAEGEVQVDGTRLASVTALVEWLQARGIRRIDVEFVENGDYETIGKLIFGCQRFGIEMNTVKPAA